MNATHTPGPWEADTADFPIIIRNLHEGEPDVVVARIDEHDAVASDRAEANARLIAAAPEMRELLAHVFSLWAAPNGDGHAVVDHDALTKLQDAANTLLARIDGEG